MKKNNLSLVSPEYLGIPSESINRFLDQVQEKQLPMHSFLLLRHGKIAAEGYWPPFDENRFHRMYSVSKSFTSVAVGMMVDEGKLRLDDKVASFFPEYLPENPHPYTLEATVEHLLMMATQNETNSYSFESKDFVETFFTDAKPKHKPGTIFHYDTAGTTVLCAIVEKLAGKPMLEYMRPVLDEIGFSEDATCIETPEGRSWTGSGILCTPRDLARFALLCLNKGAWNGKQLVSQAYMEAATTPRINNAVARTSCGNAYGYGYQFWGMMNGGFGCFGMGSQFAFCMPEKDAIMVTTADTQMLSGAEDLLVDAFHQILGSMQDEALPEDTASVAQLQNRLANLSIPLPEGANTSSRSMLFAGKTYEFEANRSGFKWMRFTWQDDQCVIQYENPTGTHQITLGMGHYAAQQFPEKYSGKRIGTLDRHYQCIAAGAWVDDHVLMATLYSVDDHLGTLRIQFAFTESELCVFMTKTAEFFFNEYTGFLTGYAKA